MFSAFSSKDARDSSFERESSLRVESDFSASFRGSRSCRRYRSHSGSRAWGSKNEAGAASSQTNQFLLALSTQLDGHERIPMEEGQEIILARMFLDA